MKGLFIILVRHDMPFYRLTREGSWAMGGGSDLTPPAWNRVNPIHARGYVDCGIKNLFMMHQLEISLSKCLLPRFEVK